MKRNPFTRTLGILLSLLLLVGVMPLAALPVAAQNITGLMYASNMKQNDGVVLKGDTHLYMDVDLTVPYIEGDYTLAIEGSGKLTVNGNGNGIAVKNLFCTSDLYIQTGWHAIEAAETVNIGNTENFVVGGIYAEGDIEIHSYNATIAGNGNAILSNGGNITLSGGTFDIGANGVTVYAKTGDLYMTGAFTVNSNNDRTLHVPMGELVINGSLKSTSGARFDPDVHFIDRDRISIGAREGFFFYGTTLEVEGLGGIGAGNYNGDADISITADSVSIITERYYALNGGNIYVDSDNLWIENRGSEENENVSYTYYTIWADGDATLYSENGGIVGEECLFAGGNLTLNGNFVVGADHDSGYAMRSIGRTEVNGNLRVIADDILCVYAEKGFSFNGSTLKLEGHQGIAVQNGDVNIVADSTEIVVSDYCAIRDATEHDSVCNVYIDSDYLWLQGGKDEVRNSGCVDVDGYVTIYSDEATIMGNYGIDASGDVFLDGNFVVLGLLQEAIRSESRVEARGKLSLATEGEYHSLMAEAFVFDGSTLVADGYAGIWGRVTEINADSVAITAKVGAALHGDEVYVIANYLWAENKATKAGDGEQYGIAANSKLALTVKGGTVIGYDDALHVYDEYDQFDAHYIYVDGHLTAVSQTGVGMYAPQGTVELYGGPIVSVGESHGIDGKNVIFEGGSLRVEGDTGIHAMSSVKLTGEDVRITAFNERRSGIWVENGHADLKGKVVIKTNGWYGINADTHVSFEEGYYQIIGPKNDAQAVKARGFLYLDGTLEIIQPDGGHVNGNDIYGAGDSPALNLEMYSAIRDVSLLIDGPRDGKLPDRNASDVYFLDPRCTVESIVWYEDGEEMVSQDALFRAGHRYTVKITLSADDPYRFVHGVMGKVNDRSVTTGILGDDKKGMVLTADLGECPLAIGSVDLGIRSPEEGKAPSTAVSSGSSAYGVYGRDVRWTVSTDGVNFVPMAAGEKFVGGKYYRVFMDVNLAGNHYKFPITTADGTLQPDVVATVNGSPAVVKKAYDQDPSTVITVYFDFGKCNDYLIEEITIVDVVAPVAGQHPNYDVNMFGTGYHVDTTKNAYEDIYWKNPPEKWYYIKNGVSWWDVTDGGYEYVFEHDVFLPGHQYKCKVFVHTDDGYEFVNDIYADVFPAATVNGNPATIQKYDSGLNWSQEVTYTFTCAENVVDRIVVDGIAAPQKGQAPDYSPILGNTALYTLDTDYGLNGSGIYWYDCEGRQLEAGEVFGDAGPYRMAIKFVPVYEDGAPLCTFADDVAVMINGKYVTPYGNWDDVMVGSGTVWAFYTFRNGTSAPEGEQTYTLSGSINVSGATVTLLRDGNVVSTLTASSSYSIENLAVGVYTLQMSKDGYEPVEYSIVIATDMVKDVELVASAPAYISGDVDGNGKVNNRDLGMLQLYLNDDDLTDRTFIWDAADMDGNGKVNNRDLGLLQKQLNN